MNNDSNDKNHKNPVPARASLFGRIFIYFILILIIPIFWYIHRRNTYRAYELKITEAEANITILLQKKENSLIQLVRGLQRGMDFENSALDKVLSARNKNNQSLNEKINDLSDLQNKVFLQFENYPNLKSAENVEKLMSIINEVEQDIASMRRIYNSNINQYNMLIKTFPSNVVAADMKLWTKPFLEFSVVDRQDIV